MELSGPYSIEFRPAALRQLKKVPPEEQAKIRGAIALLARDPYPPRVKALKGRPGLRVCVGDYRIIYTVEDRRLVVVVVKIGNRRDVYR
ncbi:mRNA interferase RelE/StbE [Arcanobacterium wilhelmae]|uniref:mRNA interferase RelE/StbE n=1 Tax=Arcanobacterium wilhelmae TaxID=1803177 RepID=A0ABT9NC16_9ACTO|nr:type II toxin-antitoxin system RelE/ParE family toxin [Arcanobacterium wilhelmae]MDP9801269.1 mRNA interferase RelE/StbE [Arcanobacterium wilhelmae]WFN90615.1 type II toxin-antitoxin system RelE/ParE family toxin [Arcanobacterium wilhelmae]